MSDAQDITKNAETLQAAAAIMRRYFGGLETTIAVLEEKAAVLLKCAQ